MDNEDYMATSRNGHALVDTYNPIDNTLDIYSNGLYPSNVLSNMCSNAFVLDGVQCGSMEGFLQGLKRQDLEQQRAICAMRGGNAKNHSVATWQQSQTLWWQGTAIPRDSEDFSRLISRAYSAMYEQCETFRVALQSTKGIVLTHKRGATDATKTILTAQEFCVILTTLRDNQ